MIENNEINLRICLIDNGYWVLEPAVKNYLPPFGHSMAMCKRTIFPHSLQTKERQLILVSTTSPPFNQNRTLNGDARRQKTTISQFEYEQNKHRIMFYNLHCAGHCLSKVMRNTTNVCTLRWTLVGSGDQAVGTTHRQPYVWHKPNYITMNQKKKRKKQSVQTFISIVVRSSQIR